MSLNCPDCRYPIPYDDINIVQTIAKCKQCSNIFEFAEKEDGSNRPLLSPRRKELVIPPGVEVLSLANELEVAVKWRESDSFAIPFGAIVSFLSIIALFFLFFVIGGDLFTIIYIGPFMFGSIAGFMTSMAYLFNTTYITATEDRLAIEHKPIKAFFQSDKYYVPEQIDQLYTKRYVKEYKDKRPIYAFAVEIQLKDGQKQVLVDNLHSAQYGRFIEQEVEFFMKIQDRPIREEWKVREED